MNFKMKALVAAVALTASMSASAAMTQSAFQSGSTSKIGDSSLILTLIDNNNSISATFDLGYSYSTFAESLVATGPNLLWDLASNADYSAAWTSFTSGANLANSHWAIFAGDNFGTGAGAKGMIVTYTTLPLQNVTTSELGTQLSGMDVYIADNSPLGNHLAVSNGANTTVLGTEWAGQSGAYNADGKVGLKGPVTWGSFDQSLGVVKFLGGATVTSRLTSDVYANQFGASAFALTSNGALTYTNAVAAVPEADTWAMLLAGLGLMGFIARRRTAA